MCERVVSIVEKAEIERCCIRQNIDMRPQRLSAMIILPLALITLAACSPRYVEPEPPKFTDSLNDVRSASQDFSEEIIAEIPSPTELSPSNPKVESCDGEADGIGRWSFYYGFNTTDIKMSISAVRAKFADIETSQGTKKETQVLADGITLDVDQLEDTTGSYVLYYAGREDGSGAITLTVTTVCGVL